MASYLKKDKCNFPAKGRYTAKSRNICTLEMREKKSRRKLHRLRNPTPFHHFFLAETRLFVPIPKSIDDVNATT